MPTKAKIKTDTSVPVKVTEITDASGNTRQTKVYETEAEIIDTNAEVDNEGEKFDDESEIENFDEPYFDEIPKDKLDVMFDEIQGLTDGYGTYFAKVTRQPDSLADNFFIRCNGEMPLGVFQFSMRDRFNFIPQLQKLNNNSGGYFNILIYDQTQKPLEVLMRYDYDSTRRTRTPIMRQVGCHNLLVPNPVILQENGQLTNNNEIGLLVKAIQDMQANFQQQINNIINRPNEKSPLEKAVEQKMLNDLLNPPEKSNQFEQTMMSIMAMPVMVEKMSAKIFPETPQPQPEREPTLVEQAVQVMQTPVAQNLAESLGNAFVDLSETYKISKMKQLGVTPQLNPAIDTEEKETDFNMLEEIITELESENPIISENPLLQRLANEHQKEFNELASYCQIMSFQQIWTMLQIQAQKLEVNPLIQFANAEETQKQNVLVLNERGEKVYARLIELYKLLNPNWLQTNPNL